MNNFAITSEGRSGTKFLARLMNESKKWCVRHEPSSSISLKNIQPRFNRENYGEVNSFLRFCFKDLKVSKKGIILRSSKEIILSASNRKFFNKDLIFKIKEALLLLDNYIISGIPYFKFKLFVSDVDYCKKLLNYFDIYDVKITEPKIRKKRNQNKIIKYNTFEEVPNASKIMEFCDWFDKKYDL